MAWVN